MNIKTTNPLNYMTEAYYSLKEDEDEGTKKAFNFTNNWR